MPRRSFKPLDTSLNPRVSSILHWGRKNLVKTPLALFADSVQRKQSKPEPFSETTPDPWYHKRSGTTSQDLAWPSVSKALHFVERFQRETPSPSFPLDPSVGSPLPSPDQSHRFSLDHGSVSVERRGAGGSGPRGLGKVPGVR